MVFSHVETYFISIGLNRMRMRQRNRHLRFTLACEGADPGDSINFLMSLILF